MSFLFGKKPAAQPQAQQTQPLNALRVNESVRGKIVPVSLGTNRQKQFLLWNGDFKKVAHTTPPQNVGGGGGSLSGGGGAGTIPGQTTYTYTTAYQAGLGFGTVDHIANVWTNGGRVGAVLVQEDWTVPTGGGTHRPNQPHGIGNRGVGIYQPYDSGVLTDFGASSSQHLTGTFVSPVAVAASPSSGVVGFVVDGTGPIWTADASLQGQTLQLSYSANLGVVWTQVEVAITAGAGLHFTVASPSTFNGWSSVVALDGTQFFGPTTATLVSTWYAADNAGNFTFAAADAGKTVTITYQSTDTSVTAGSTLNFSLSPGTEGQSPWAWMAVAHPSQSVGNTGMATVQSNLLDLGGSNSIPQLSFETVIHPGFQFATGQSDCNPQDVMYAYLRDNNLGINFPAANIEFGYTIPASTSTFTFVPAVNQPGNNAASFWAANSFFISPLIENQTTVATEFQNYLDAGQTALLFSEGLLKLRPYGDTLNAGNGYIYQPLTQPVVDLNNDDFMAASGADPIKITRASWDGSFNKVQVQFSDRLTGYNSEVVTEEDPAGIQANGVHTESPQNWDFVKTWTAAQWAANMRVRRLSNIRNTYEFVIPPTYDYLEPMDLVTLTSSPLGLSFKPVRIISIEDDPANGLKIVAEDFPYGVAKAALYPKQNNIGFHDSPATHQPGNTTPLILEMPDPASLYKGYTVRIYGSPVSPADWGGCNVLQSFDNVTYSEIGQIRSAAIFGTLNATLAAGTGDPDTGTVSISVSDGMQLLPTSTYDFNNKKDPALLAIIDAGGTFEFVAYNNATLTATNTYTIGSFHRGLFGTTRAAHVSGAKIVKLDQGHIEINYTSANTGQTMWIKMPSFNTMGGLLQDASVLTPVSVALTGANPGIFDLTTGQTGSSRSLNPQGGILPNQAISIAYSYLNTIIAAYWGAQTPLRSDGTTLAISASTGATKLTNGDMESGTLGVQETGWTNISSNGLITANDFVHSGTKAGKMAGGATSESTSNTYSLTAGQIYVVEGWVKQDAMPTVSTHFGAGFQLVIDTGITSWTILTKFGAFDVASPTVPQMSLPADNTARPYTFLQMYLIPTASGTAHLTIINQSISGNGWFDDVKVYPFSGAIYSGLSASTNYYLYPYVNVASGTIQFTNPTPPTTSPNATFAAQAGLDGRIALAPLVILTAANPPVGSPPTGGGGSGGDGPICPEVAELIEVSRGIIKAGDILVGDMIKGYSFQTSQDVFREVISTTKKGNSSWRVVRGKKVSPVEPVYVDGQWMPAYLAPGATLDTASSQKVQITVRSDDYNESNYYLVDGTPLLIHNFIIPRC
jgi:hypothetical protein